MNKDLTFEQIHPFIRYARFLELNKEITFPPFTPYDCRLFYTYKGHGAISIGNEKYDMPQGSLMLWGSSIPYHLISPHDNSVVYIAVSFDFTYDNFEKNYPIPPDIIENFKQENVLENINFINLPLFNKPVYLNNMQLVENELLEIENEFSHRKLYYNIKISSIFESILLTAARRISSINSDNEESKNKANAIINYIHNHYMENLRNQDVGELFNYHPNYVNNLMVVHTGLSLHQYVIALRISKAIDLLEATNMQINEIAYAVGFKDICHFSRYFKKTTGRNPSDFRRTSIR